MIISFLSIILATIVVSFFSFTVRLNGLNRTLSNIPKQIFECAIPLANQDDEEYLTYDKAKVEEKCNEYFDATVYKYVSSYLVRYYFYNTENKGVCDIKDCQGVEIYFEAPITSFYIYKNQMFYEIRRVG